MRAGMRGTVANVRKAQNPAGILLPCGGKRLTILWEEEQTLFTIVVRANMQHWLRRHWSWRKETFKTTAAPLPWQKESHTLRGLWATGGEGDQWEELKPTSNQKQARRKGSNHRSQMVLGFTLWDFFLITIHSLYLLGVHSDFPLILGSVLVFMSF